MDAFDAAYDKLVATSTDSRPGNGNMQRPSVPPLPSRPQTSQGALVAGNFRQHPQAAPSSRCSQE